MCDSTNGGPKPYEYQEKRALEPLARHFEKHDRALLVMATGLGKTIVSAFWAKEQLKHGRGLFLCQDSRILQQAMHEFREVLGENVTMGIFYGGQKTYEAVDIWFVTFQSMRDLKTALFEDEFYFTIVDECHHSMAETYKPVLEYFAPKKMLGMTATPDRMDGKDIRDLFGDEVVYVGLEEAIASGWLANVDYRVMTDSLDNAALKEMMAEIGKSRRRVSIRQLNEKIFIRKRDEEIAKQIVDFDMKTIVFCEGIEHADNFVKFLPNAKTVHSGHAPAHNERTLQEFRDNEIRYVVTVNQLNEGVDVPDAGLIVFLRCTDSKTIFLQQLGRGLRKTATKDKVIVLDFVANCDRVIFVQQLANDVLIQAGKKPNWDNRKIHLSGASFSFDFTEDVRDIAEIVRMVQKRLYISDIPHLLAEYMRDKNPLPPEQVLAGSEQKCWWKCQKPNCGHEWLKKTKKRLSKGCPACCNQVATEKNCLKTTHPNLAKEWHPTKNESYTPRDFVAGSSKKVWWLCAVCGHEWETIIYHRSNGNKCPACSNKVVTESNCLAATHPELAREWHPTKNKGYTPKDFVAGSSKKAWWLCVVCGYEWEEPIAARKKGDSCRACANKVATENNCLTSTHPELAREWHPTRNEGRTPRDVVSGSHQKAWWLCPTCGYEWETIIAQRANGSGCRACVNKVATESNCLAATHPELAREWHPTRNEDRTPQDFVAGSNKTAWWLCTVCRYEWKTTICSRAKAGTGCRKCATKTAVETRRRTNTLKRQAKEAAAAEAAKAAKQQEKKETSE